jgi:endonuclease YncB( thermonuclease family)
VLVTPQTVTDLVQRHGIGCRASDRGDLDVAFCATGPAPGRQPSDVEAEFLDDPIDVLGHLRPGHGAATGAPCPLGTLTGEVTHVRDGDTIVVGSIPIRLNGLAAPEWDEPGGAAAAQAMIGLVSGRTLRCELDGERTHDRCVGICYLEDVDISAEMVRRGVARDCPRFSGGRYRGVEAQATARRSGEPTGCRGIAVRGRSSRTQHDPLWWGSSVPLFSRRLVPSGKAARPPDHALGTSLG